MTSSSPVRFVAIFFGLLAIAAIPGAAAASAFLSSLQLLGAAKVAVPAAFVCGLLGVSATRRARFRVERTVARRGERTVRLARFLVWSGLYLAVVGGLALGFYGLLNAASS